ncbi:MAG: ribonuclease P protein component [Bacteroidetes bacterium]|nr:ribonuclease P protein component [Bacteroidota bacterium]
MSKKELNNLVAPLTPSIPANKLPKTSILRGKKAFKELFEASQSFRSGSLLFRYSVSVKSITESDPPVQSFSPSNITFTSFTPKVAFIAPKRIGNAVLRNRNKRYMREAYRHASHELNLFTQLHALHLHLGIIARYSSTGISKTEQDMQRGLEILLGRLKNNNLTSPQSH